ncbi:hypothetical protein IL306_010138 [Fusarium sp. DS 682]|nr:hypothetical protein IL306_010138 [Fusarium sp. DS 682]
MQNSFIAKIKSQTQMALGLSSPQASGDDMPQMTLISTGKSGQIFARIKEKTKEWHRLRRSGGGNGHLRARYLADQANNQGQKLPTIVISPPDVEPQQPPSARAELPAELPAETAYTRFSNSFRKRLPRSWSANEKEALGSRPVVIPRDYHQGGQIGDTSTASHPKLCDRQDAHEGGATRAWRKEHADYERNLRILVDEPQSSHSQRCVNDIAQKNELVLLEGHAQTLKRKCEQLAEEKLELEQQILATKQFASSLYCRAHEWEVWIPIPEDPVPLMQVVTGLQTIMLWMQGRIQWYERKHPELREEYNTHMGLL